ncbi:MAG: quinone-dependent dihydroorotate dehydrogenase [Verrucomicrobia bacterium]|nr:quinone-dependent dihydroorotate dehydrogenase [Verrucomicrobiota bacterium]MCH8511925.1 quinone-dependent dihydroorotate dehydrogenase [Kiritimatiellia bacterium]
MIYPLFKRIAFCMDPEKVHERTLNLLQRTACEGKPHFLAGPVPEKPVEVMGIRFPNPVGLAAGMDKNGACIEGFGSLGFGFLELGTVTPRPQPGNPKPRLFRLPEHEGILNRMGFNNDGVEALLAKINQSTWGGVIGVNIGKNFDTPIERAAEDYVTCLKAVYSHADYIAINISSPNTTNLRELQKGDAFTGLLRTITDASAKLEQTEGKKTPLAVKIAPDMDETQLDFIAETLLRYKVDAVIATNTTLDRSAVADHPLAKEAGGLSGAPVRQRSTEVIRGLAKRLDGQLPIIGVGGIFSAADAREKLDAGASLVQIYSGLIYRGPRLVSEIVRGI